MFGLTFEKLLLVVLVAGMIIGPRRLPVYAGRLAQTIRALRTFVETARVRAAEQTGLPLADGQWEALDLRRYDPRRIVRDALSADAAPPADAELRVFEDAETDASSTPAPLWTSEQIARIRPGQRFVTVGGSSHPTRLPIASLPDDDPVRRAAREVVEDVDDPSESGGHAAPVRTSPSMTG